MSGWIERVLKEFPPDLSRLWIAADPDQVLLDEQVLKVLRARGFEVLPLEDSVVFRAEFEERYRAAWDRGERGPANSLIIQFRATTIEELPWDYVRQARRVRLGLADLFPKLSYVVIRQLDPEYLELLFDLQSKHISQPLGETSTKDFLLTHIFQFSPQVISSSSDFWRDLLRLQNRDLVLPSDLAKHVQLVLAGNAALSSLQMQELLTSKGALLRFVQDDWARYLNEVGVLLARDRDQSSPEDFSKPSIPFDHPDVRVVIESMFLNGTLHPEIVRHVPSDFRGWATIGISNDPEEKARLVLHGTQALIVAMPASASSHREWTQFAERLGELIARFHSLDSGRAKSIEQSVVKLQTMADEGLHGWVTEHYADLPSLPAIKGPVLVHHIPRFLSHRRSQGEQKIALLVFDGMAIDQWVHVRDHLSKQLPKVGFDETACFAWLPTLTSVSRQALFSGLKPREMPRSLDDTSRDPIHWSRFWQDQGLRANEVFYERGIRRTDQIISLKTRLANERATIVGLVINTIDDFVHGAVLGKRGVASQIVNWLESGFATELFSFLLSRDYHVYITADHGNKDAVGQGRPNQGVLSELNGQRVRVYDNETAVENSRAIFSNTFRLNVPGLPPDFLPLFSGGQTAFVLLGEQAVVHGGISVEELIVPFIKVVGTSDSI